MLILTANNQSVYDVRVEQEVKLVPDKQKVRQRRHPESDLE